MKMDPTLHRDKKPDWIKVRLPNNPAFWSTKSLITDHKQVTVCEEAQSPNRGYCYIADGATTAAAQIEYLDAVPGKILCEKPVAR